MSDINWDDENDTTTPAPPKRKSAVQLPGKRQPSAKMGPSARAKGITLEAAIRERQARRDAGTDPACISTYKKSGPLFGSWDAHATYLLQREAELVSELEMTRSDLAKVRRRKAEERDGQD